MIFLTGGTGMLGAHLLADITKNGGKVRALKRKNSDLQYVRKIFSWYNDEAEQLFRQIEWIDGDMLDRSALRDGMEGVDVVIHAAAMLSFDPRDRYTMLYENAEGTRYLVDLALELGIPRFCHVSSIAALGDSESGIPVNEDFSWKNDRKRSAYAESKFQSEMEVWRGVHEGLNGVIVNPSVILGAGNWNSGSPRFFKTIHDGFKFYPSGSNGFVDARDVSKAIIALVNSKAWENISGQRYVLSAENRSYREIFAMIAEALDLPGPAIRANRFLLQVGWRMSALTAFLAGKQPSLTKDTARSSAKNSAYDGAKIRSAIAFNYTPVAQSIADIGKIYREEYPK